MAYSQIEQKYLNTLSMAAFPEAVDEEPSLEGMQLAAGPSETRTDAGPRFGRGGVTKAQSQAAGGLEKPLGGMLDMGAATVKGIAQGFGGTPGDFEGLARTVINFMGGNVDETTVLPTTDEVKAWLDKFPMARVGNGKNPYESIGEVVAPGGYIKGAKQALKGAKAAGQALAPTAAGMVEQGLRKSGLIMDVVPPGPNVVSTRLPTAKKATEDPLQSKLTIDYAAAKSDPEAFSHNMGLIKQYPNFVSRARNPERQAEDFITHVKDNLLYLYDQVPEATRQRSKLWYDGARNITDRFSAEYGLPDQAVSGVLAVLSPQKDWFMNVSLGQRVIDIAKNQAGRRWGSAMDDTAARIWADPKYDPVLNLVRGKTYTELQTPGERALWLRTFDQAFNPREHQIVSPEGDFMGVRMTQSGKPYATGWGSLNEIGKAVAILEDPSLANISTMLGQQHKVRNFYNNIYAPGDPAGHVTIDTHAVAAGLLRPLSGNSREVLHNFGSGVVGEVGPKNSSVTGVQGTYGLFAEAYRRAAAERGVLPREMQSITWEAVRGLFPDTFKTAKNSQAIDDIWLKYRRGQLSLEEARNDVIRTAGGIQPPEWERAGLRSGSAEAGGPGTNAGELPGAGVPRGRAGGSGRVQPAAGDQTSVTRGRRAPTSGAQ